MERDAVGFVDIHSHILHGLDDGAKTLDDSVEMLRIAAAGGTTDIVATPHANGQYRFDPEIIDRRIAELEAHTDVRIHRGCDFHLQPDTIMDALAHPDKYTINGRAYLMLEFPEMTIFPNAEAILLQFLDAGIVPIITHPERNGPLQRRLDDIAEWVGLGCYVQVTAGSCTGTFGKTAQSCALALMRRGLVHFIASDAHNCQRRSPDLQPAFETLARSWGEDSVRPLFEDNPRAVLTGDPIDYDFQPDEAPRRRWYQFWR